MPLAARGASARPSAVRAALDALRLKLAEGNTSVIDARLHRRESVSLVFETRGVGRDSSSPSWAEAASTAESAPRGSESFRCWQAASLRAARVTGSPCCTLWLPNDQRPTTND